MWGEFRFISMERGELCHDRCAGLLLADRMQDIGAAKSEAKARDGSSLDITLNRQDMRSKFGYATLYERLCLKLIVSVPRWLNK